MSLPDFITSCVIDNCHSDDLVELQSTLSQVPVFIYGREKATFSEHDILKYCPRMGIGFTENSDYVLAMCGRDPLAFYCPNEAKSARIQGEVFIVPVKTLFTLDASFTNNVKARREAVTVTYYRPSEKDILNPKFYFSRVFMYEGIHENLPKWRNGMTFERMSSNRSNRLYYTFAKNDDKTEGVFL